MRARFETLDAIRGVAALAVVLYHMRFWFPAGLWVPGGYLAVDFFFLLSGFVIAHAYDARLRDGLSAPAFLKLRVIRLYPIFALGLLVGIGRAVALLGSGESPLFADEVVRSAMMNAAFLPSTTTTGLLFALNTPYWSLFFEMAACAVFAVCHPQLGNRVLACVVGLAGAGVAAAALQHGSLDVGFGWSTVWGGAVRVTFGFSLGVLLYRLRDRIGLPRLGAAPLLAVAFIVPSLPVGEALRPLYDIAAVLVLFPLLLLVAAEATPSAGQRQAFVVLGVISYPLYAIHHPIVRLFGTESLGWAAPLIAAGVTVGLVVACYVIATAYDAPTRAWLTARLRPGRGVARA